MGMLAGGAGDEEQPRPPVAQARWSRRGEVHVRRQTSRERARLRAGESPEWRALVRAGGASLYKASNDAAHGKGSSLVAPDLKVEGAGQGRQQFVES
ncbi:hypothetical protein GCM10022211_09540 [Sphingomonas humi]|uniref:Uncharacterized protein n=1 Tax=Sphingomonas humi TaxID=335630 RepID=A0ABP7RQT6_9SPHN